MKHLTMFDKGSVMYIDNSQNKFNHNEHVHNNTKKEYEQG